MAYRIEYFFLKYNGKGCSGNFREKCVYFVLEVFMSPIVFQTPFFVKRLVKIIAAVTLGAVALEGLFGWPMHALLLFNSSFFSEWRLWQPLTSLFMLPCPSLAFGPLLDMTFIVALFWLFAAQVHDCVGKWRFITLCIVSASAAAIAAGIGFYFLPDAHPITLCSPLILALVTVWGMSGSTNALSLMFFFPFSQKWLLAIALLGTIGANLISHEFVLAGAYAAAFLSGYLLAIMRWYWKSPFESLGAFEARLKRFASGIERFWQWKILPLFRKKPADTTPFTEE
jgi:hypothetical protein